MESLENNIPSDLHINMTLSSPNQNKSKSQPNSPKIPGSQAARHFTWYHQSQKEISPNIKQNPENSEAFQHKLEGLEEIGLFSEFFIAKPTTKLNEKEDKSRKSTIHLTDFMMPLNKRKILQNSGGLDFYLSKRKEYQNDLIREQSNLNDFFQHREKKPGFFLTPQISPRYLPKNNFKPAGDDFDKSKHLSMFNCIMDKCDEAMKIKVTQNFSKSSKCLKSDLGVSASKSRGILAKLTE